MTSFEELGLPDFLIQSLRQMKIVTPTPIQAEAIPPALTGSDILASAQTGSGKTLAYMIPLFMNLFQNPQATGLILLPTRELANQVKTNFIQLRGKGIDLHAAVLIGGEPMGKQFHQLRGNPRLIIGTPGRICDHLNRGTLDLSKTKFLVLDEMDRMLDMGFSDSLEEIYDKLPEEKQTFMFSATLPNYIEKAARKYLKEHERIAVGSALEAAKEIEQAVIHTPSNEKFTKLVEELSTRDGSVIVFVKTKRSADEVAELLREEGHKAEAIHGDLHQKKRERVVLSFRKQRSRIMVATDIAARGLDVPHVQHVINYDLPECPEDYIHRIGRTGRAGAQGFSLSFISPDEKRKWNDILAFMNPELKNKKSGGQSNDSRARRPSYRGRSSSQKSFGSPRFGSFERGSFERKSFDGPREFDGQRKRPMRDGGFQSRDGEFTPRDNGFSQERRSPGRFSSFEGGRNFRSEKSSQERAPFKQSEGSFEKRSSSFGRSAPRYRSQETSRPFNRKRSTDSSSY